MNIAAIITISLLFCTSSLLKAQNNLEALLNMVETGKAYALYKAKAGDENVVTATETHYFHLVPPIYETILDTVELAPALNGNLDTSNYFIQTEILVLKEPGVDWKTATISPMCRPEQGVPHVALCLLKTTPEYKIIHRKFFPFKTIYDTTATDYIIPAQVIIVKRKILKQKTRLYYLTKPQSINVAAGEKLVQVPAGKWKNWDEITCPFGEFNDPSITQIQEALIKQDYPIKVTNKFDEQTKRNLLLFQQDNMLEEGGITDQTLKRLGISRERLISIDF
ncbi:MAG: peptidoglycan-binding domain-containing protein [Aureispira sp.]